jgi:class 3 adenylate cyclase
MPTCRSCRAPLPAGALFCPSCGTEVEPPAAPASEERKLATILFADLVGSTELAGSQDPERTRALLERFYRAMAAEIAGAGGTVEKFVGDAVMAAFGAPSSQEDHAERALHAALSMQRRLEELFGETLSLRIGVNTGELVVGTPREGSSFVSGDAVNVAARLEQAADPGQILVGERTAIAVRGAFELGEPIRVQAKGKPGGVVCRRLIRAISLMRPRGVAGLPPAFVGRGSELELLKDTYERVAAEARPHLVTIVGSPGIGKTTLVRHFWEWLGTQSPEPWRRTGRCLPSGRGSAYLAVGEIVREHLGLLESDALETVQRRLGERDMLGLTLGLEAPADLHPLAARDRLYGAWLELLAELVGERPTVVLVEDLHWAEDALVELLEPVVRDVEGPLLLVATGRPELAEERPAWGRRRRDSTWLELEPLSASDAKCMLEALFPAALPARVRKLVLRRAEGNPFFVEELVATLIDEGVLERRNGCWTVHDVGDDLGVPDTLQAVVAARVDLLPATEKAALQAASVIGRVFWSGPVYELLDGLQPDLRVLEERDFIRPNSASTIAGEREFVIKHALTREVAYASLPKARRARLHARFAGWLEDAGQGRDEQAALLAAHYAEATRPSDADLAWSDEDETLAQLRAKAVAWMGRAAELAIGRFEIDDARALLNGALEREDDRRAQLRLWLEIGRASALAFDGNGFSEAMQQALELAQGAEETANVQAELVFQTLIRAGMWRTITDPRLVDEWIERALELAAPKTPARAKALVARCYADREKSAEVAAEASAAAEWLGEASLRSYGLDVRGLAAFAVGDYDEALSWQRRRLGLIDEIDDPDHQADVYASAIAPCVAQGLFEEAARYTAAHEEITRGLSSHHRVHGVSALVELDELLGNWERVRAFGGQVEEAVGANAATPCVRNPRSLLVCALANIYSGDEKEARRLEELAEWHEMSGYGTVINAPRTRLALERGALEQVEELLGDPAVRRTTWNFLSSMATQLDALAALGRRDRVETETRAVLGRTAYLEPFALRALGVVRQDERLIEQAARLFESMGLAWHEARTRVLLDEASPSRNPG